MRPLELHSYLSYKRTFWGKSKIGNLSLELMFWAKPIGQMIVLPHSILNSALYGITRDSLAESRSHMKIKSNLEI
jgi:hypothetical protein